MSVGDRFPGIRRAALEIALDNGGINRSRPIGQQRRELKRWIARQPQEPLREIDAWLAGLSDEDLNTVCAGEASEQDVLLKDAPPFTDKLLNDYFEEVC
ncbi:hypothetical protein [Bosea sp. (in: a-proteobacteria)]|jgi:hypothetical protein|uniref:hypothetical protein n=1 Tax=Bosea sp. (in: a-proteobacteria) TaxID=1871050 RepID=UPI003566B142